MYCRRTTFNTKNNRCSLVIFVQHKVVIFVLHKVNINNYSMIHFQALMSSTKAKQASHTCSSILPICINRHGQCTTPTCPNVHTKYCNFEFALAEFCAKFAKINALLILPLFTVFDLFFLLATPLSRHGTSCRRCATTTAARRAATTSPTADTRMTTSGTSLMMIGRFQVTVVVMTSF